MPLFDTSEVAIPRSRSNAPPEASPQAPEEIKNMSGFSSIADVAKAAKQETSGSDINTSVQTRASKKKIADIQAEAKAKAEAEEKERRKRIAMERVGKRLCSKLSKAPYQVWASLLSDPELKLSKEEEEELNEDYILLMQGFDVDFSKPIWIILGLLGSHAVIVQSRIAYLEKKQRGIKTTLRESQALDNGDEEEELDAMSIAENVPKM